jgi:predicted TIM-barrel fold metal-dependent hydrolase
MSQGWGWTGLYPDFRLDEPGMSEVWELIDEKKMAVIIDPGPINNPGYQIDAIDKLTDLFRNTQFVIEHLGYMTPDQFGKTEAYIRWETMISLGKKDNVVIGCSAMQAVMEEDYPCSQSIALLQKVVQLIGSEKVLWGSDIPTTLNSYTYYQQIQLISRLAEFLSDTEKERILGLNARDFLFKGD